MNAGAYGLSVTADLKPEEIQPWAATLAAERTDNFRKDDPAQMLCLPQGTRANFSFALMKKIVQTPTVIAILPHTEALRLIERYRRIDFGHLEIVETIEDPGAYTRPFTVRIAGALAPDTEMLEYGCSENERDRAYITGKES